MSADGAKNATTEVVVVIGAGAIGQAIARRIGVAKTILLADINADAAKKAAKEEKLVMVLHISGLFENSDYT